MIKQEKELNTIIHAALTAASIYFRTEVKIGKGCRVDFLVGERIVIEVKKGKPNSNSLAAQVGRYAMFDKVDAIIMVVEANVFEPVEESNGKKIYYVPLRKAWGISL